MYCSALSVLEKSNKFIEKGVSEAEVKGFLTDHHFFSINKLEVNPKEAYPFNFKASSLFNDEYIVQISDFDFKLKRIKDDGRMVNIDTTKFKADWRAYMAEKFEDYVPALEMYLEKREVIVARANEQTPIF